MTVLQSRPALALPEMNALVQVRGRHWVVTEVRRGTVDVDVRGGAHQVQHVVELTSVEDDGLGEDLTVVWEVEPDASILYKETLPAPHADRFDDPARLDAFLNAVRWGAITSADSQALQAPFRSGITIEDYQLDPVVRALSMPRVNLLIADDVGLGKTIEAGLVVQEMILRHRARSVIVVCPASLCLKWRSEMAEKFGLEFRIVDAELVRRLRRERGLAANPWKHFPRLIVSMDWLKRPRAMSLLREVLPPAPTYPREFDILLIDEVHNVAPSGGGQYATDSQRTKAIREIAPHFEHHLYLSATPHNGYRESWTALLELLDPQRFARGVGPAEASLRRAMVRRLKSELRDDPALANADGTPRFAVRRIEELEVAYPDHEREVHRLLSQYSTARHTATGTDTTARQATDFVTLLLKKRLFSSPAAFSATLGVHMRTLASQGERQGDSHLLQAAFDRLDDDVADEAEYEEAVEEALAAVAEAGGSVDDAQRQLLEAMVVWAEEWREKADAKATRLLEFIDETCRPQAANGVRSWNDERVIVFTEYRDTQLYLYQLLADRLPQGELNDRVALLHGGMDEGDRERIKAEFQADPSRRPLRVLLATDAASEGIDLQLHCHRVIHIETPFNPARMEQRNGRVDRHLQPSPEVLIYHFIGAGWREAAPGSLEDDLQFLNRLAHKLNAAREDLGKVGPLLAVQVERRMLGDETASVEVQPDPRREAAAGVLRVERNLREEVARLARRLEETRIELGISPGAVEHVVRVGLGLARQAPLVPATLDRSPTDRRPAGPVFEVGQLTGSWARTVLDLPDPLDPEQIRPITFDHDVAADAADDVVLAHLGHPLVTQAMRLLRGRIWSSDESDLSRVTARIVPDAALTELVIVVHARLVITGRGGHRLHEEVIAAGGRVARGRFSREGYGVGELARVLGAAGDDLPPPHIREALARSWPTFEEQLQLALRARAEDRAESLERLLAAKVEDEVTTMRAVLDELRRGILSQLADLEEPEQLTFGFARDEREQFARDVGALRARVDAIPAEADAEELAIRRRYEEQSQRVFPAAITFLVPRRLCDADLDDVLGPAAASNREAAR
ncbi:MAG TPA: DISARM system SNF2-like helicase DrmD [Acidimicrobiales bacterium]|nr:DISARM system SNF2-like helicase DrmD [Acidimicrobiales bacterium]